MTVRAKALPPRPSNAVYANLAASNAATATAKAALAATNAANVANTAAHVTELARLRSEHDAATDVNKAAVATLAA
jgi:hypothetical protein